VTSAVTARIPLSLSSLSLGRRASATLNALAAYLPASDGVVLIEDTAELQIERPNLVRFETRREQPDFPAWRFAICGAQPFDIGRTGSASTLSANRRAPAGLGCGAGRDVINKAQSTSIKLNRLCKRARFVPPR
jgi:hypothetical protein